MKQINIIISTIALLMLVSPAWAGETFTVDDIVARAVNASHTVTAARAAELGSRYRQSSALADRLPSLDLGYGYSRLSDAPFANTASGRMVTSHKSVHTWQLTATQPLFTGFALRAAEEIARLDTSLLVKQTERKRQATVALAKAICYEVLFAEKFSGVAKETVGSLEAHRANAKSFLDQGLSPRNDLLKSEVALADAVQGLERAEATLKLARTRLALIADIGEDFTLAMDGDLNPTALDREYEEFLAVALEERPELSARELVDEKLASQEKAARSGYFPMVSLQAGYERKGDDIEASRNDYGNDHNAWVGVNMEWNLFSWGKTTNEVHQVGAAMEEEHAKTRQLIQDIIIEIKGAYLEAQLSMANIRTATSALKQAKENSRITKLQYEQQVATSTDVLDARTFLTQAETNYLGAYYGYLGALANLDFAVGKNITQNSN